MSKIALDLKKFKHVKSDDHSTTLQHKDGHILTMAHKSLSPEFQKQLSVLSKISGENETEEQKDESKLKMADGGEAKKTQTARTTNIQPNSPPSDQSADWKAQAEKAKKQSETGEFPAIYAKGGKVPSNMAPLEQDSQMPMLAEGTPDEVIPQPPVETEEAKNADIENELAAADNFANKTENPNYVSPAKEVPPEVQPNPYADQYNKIYSQVKTLNPGLPDNMVRQQALSVAEVQQDRDQADTRNLMEDQQHGHDMAVQENNRRAALGLPPIPVPAQPNTAPPPPPSNIPAVEAGTSVSPTQDSGLPGAGGTHDPESLLGAGYANRLQGINQTAAATGKLGAEQAQLLNKNIEAQQTAQAAYKDTYNQLEQERQNHMDDIKEGYVDPNNYWKDHSKIATGIGMILAGFNPTNSPNAAVNFLKFQMEQNLNAQKENLGAKQNLLSANLKQFGNARDALDMTRLMQHDIVANQLQSAAATAQSPLAKAAAMQAAGQLQMEAAPMFQQFAMRKAMMNLADKGGSPQSIDHMLGYMRVINPEMAKDMESRYVPGVGLASVPVPQDVRGQMVAKQQFGAAVNELKDWSVKHSGSLNPASIAEGKTKAANVQNLYRQGINGGVFKQGEQSFINGIVDSDPTKFFNSIRVLPKLNEVERENSNSLNILKKSYNLPVQQQSMQPQIKTINGAQYQKVQGGWKRVK